MTKEEEIKSVVGWSMKNLISKEEHEEHRKKLVELCLKGETSLFEITNARLMK